MAGFVLLKQKKESTIHINEENNENKNYYFCELKNYDFYNLNDEEEFKYGKKQNKIIIKYNIKQMKFTKGKENISFYLCSDLKDISKKKGNSIKSESNIFKKAASIIRNDKGRIEDKINKKNELNINVDDYYNYLPKIISFSEYIKNKFNINQNGYPNIIKFSQTKIEICFFSFNNQKRNWWAFLVLKDYNFVKYAGIREVNINENSRKIFKNNDILLFEIKDTSIEYAGLEFINYNYNVIHGYIKTLKKNNKFKDSNFYYSFKRK